MTSIRAMHDFYQSVGRLGAAISYILNYMISKKGKIRFCFIFCLVFSQSCIKSDKDYFLHQRNTTAIQDRNKGLNGGLIHNVYMKLKDDLDESTIIAFIHDLNSLVDIEEVINLRVGRALDTGDERLYEKYDIGLHIEFSNEEALSVYQNHSDHISLRSKYKDIFAGAPLYLIF